MLKILINHFISKLLTVLISTGQGKTLIILILIKTREILRKKAGTTLGFVMMDNVLMSSNEEIADEFIKDLKNKAR